MRGNSSIVSIQVAELARKKGFDEVTSFGYCYDETQKGYYIDYDPDYFLNSSLWHKHFAAPSREQLQVWLQKQNVFLVVDVDQTLEPKFAYKISTYKNNQWEPATGQRWSDLYYKYEEALEAGLVDALNRIN